MAKIDTGTDKQPPLEEIYQPIREDLCRVEIQIRKTLQTEDEFLAPISTHLLDTPGKRLRPALVLLSARLPVKQAKANHPTSKRSDRLISLATAVELIHTGALLHDDIIDEGRLRRGKPTINSKWGNEVAVLLGDCLHSKAFSLLSCIGSQEILSILCLATNLMCEGEITQVRRRYDLNLSEEEYLILIEKKTASLFSASCRAGAVLGEASEEEKDALTLYGKNFGMAYQIIDDCLDLIPEGKKLRKSLGSDIRKGELTLPIIYFLFESNQVKRFSSLTTLWREDVILRDRALKYSSEKAEKYFANAVKSIRLLDQSPINESLIYLVSHIISLDSNGIID